MVRLKKLKAKITRKTLIGLSVLLLLVFGVSTGSGPRADGPTVSLRAASGATVSFTTWNGRTIDGVPPEERELPYLVLYRNGTLTDAEERTLIVEVSGLVVPPAGLTVTLDLMTMHGDPDLGSNHERRIRVWRASHRIAGRPRSTQSDVTMTFMHTFTETVASGERIIATPTDYARYEVTVAASGDTNAAHRLSEEYAFLLENQWLAPLPQITEAAPDNLIVHYADMFPFRRSTHEPPSWVHRDEVTAYVGKELVPRMVEAFRVQNEEWGFAWYEDWIGYRGEDGRRQLSVALTDGRTWFHGEAPSGGHSGISLRVSDGNNASFATLTDGLLSTFHHELFHNWQRSISLHSGGDGNVSGAEDAWGVFSEGTAVLAASVGQPSGQFMQKLPGRTYMSTANGFVVRGGGHTAGLNVAYRELDPYEGAIYWRFLYEQCDGGDSQSPAAGLQVIRRVLTLLYSGQIVDIRSSTDVVTALPAIMDQALAGSLCPFQTYEGSLIAFARAIYSLRWMEGRCVEPGLPAGCGFYDPYGQYYEPPVSTIAYEGADQTYQDQIGSSFGIDLLDVQVESSAAREPLVLEFRPPAGSDAVFNVEIWQLPPSANAAVRQRVFSGVVYAEALMEVDAHGDLSYIVPAAYTGVPRTLHLIVTRLDAWESLDPTGEYSIALHPVPRS